MMNRKSNTCSFNHRHLIVGELVKQNLGQIFLRNEAKIPSLNTQLVTVTEVRMSSDLKSARAYVIPLGGKNADNAAPSIPGVGICAPRRKTKSIKRVNKILCLSSSVRKMC